MSLQRLASSFCLTILLACGSPGSGKTGPVGEPEAPAALTGNPREQRKENVNGVLFQAYHWYTPADGRLWDDLAAQAQSLSDKGVTALWLPPAYKSAGGGFDVGYGVYDAYDLGEFEQKGSRRTKYGDKAQYLRLIQAAHAAELDVYADVVMNHRMGADRTESVAAVEVDPKNRSKDISSGKTIQAWTVFDFSGRGQRYSSFRWNWSHFTGVDWDQQSQQRGRVYRFNASGKNWASEVSREYGNYDYLMGADVDFNQPEVVAEMKNWGSWYQEIANLDGFRLDAVKHIKAPFLRDWVDHVRQSSGRELFTVAEYWDFSVDVLLQYLEGQDHALFDVPLHMNFFRAAEARGSYNMANLLKDTLLERAPQRAVTFVDNHDTQPLQALQSPVQDWFKPLAYALILLRAEGYPSVFSADYTGATYENIRIPAIHSTLDLLLAARRDLAYGEQRSYFDNADIVGWTRSGDATHRSGLAVVLSDNAAGTKRMELGPGFAGACFQDLTDPGLPCVAIDNQGWGDFPVKARSFGIWKGYRQN